MTSVEYPRRLSAETAAGVTTPPVVDVATGAVVDVATGPVVGVATGPVVETVIAVLEIGGTHVSAALVSLPGNDVVQCTRFPINSKGTRAEILQQLSEAADSITREHTGHGLHWAVAIPSPFDYDKAIAHFAGVDKFESLNDFDLRQALSDRIMPRPLSMTFLNDADAAGLGEASIGAAVGYNRALCLTLGTGVGSAYLADAHITWDAPGVAFEGCVHHLTRNGVPLEDIMSRRAIVNTYHAGLVDAGLVDAGLVDAAAPQLDVREIAELARAGDPHARRVFLGAIEGLGETVADSVATFGAQLIVLGGSIAGSWDLVEPALREGLTRGHSTLSGIRIVPAQLPDDSPLVGAARYAWERAGSIHS